MTSEGVAPEKICIDHVDVQPKPDYIRALMDRGAYVEFDNFGKEFYLSEERRFIYDLERIRLLKQLIEAGYYKTFYVFRKKGIVGILVNSILQCHMSDSP